MGVGRWRASSTAGSGRVGLVGDEDLEAVAGLVGEGQLVPGARVGPLAAADRPGALWPARTGKIQRGKLGDPGAPAGSAIGIQGRLPRLLGQGQDRLLDALVAVEPDRELQLAADQFADDGVGRASGVAADQDRLVRMCLGRPSRAIASTSR
jgi:hypothetical protein